jgi:hypothetical protein
MNFHSLLEICALVKQAVELHSFIFGVTISLFLGLQLEKALEKATIQSLFLMLSYKIFN